MNIEAKLELLACSKNDDPAYGDDMRHALRLAGRSSIDLGHGLLACAPATRNRAAEH